MIKKYRTLLTGLLTGLSTRLPMPGSIALSILIFLAGTNTALAIAPDDELRMEIYETAYDNKRLTTLDRDPKRSFAVTFYYPKGMLDSNPSERQPYPLFLYSSSGGAKISDYRQFHRNLAKRGIIVAAVEHPYIDKSVVINGEVKGYPWFDELLRTWIYGYNKATAEHRLRWRQQEVAVGDIKSLLDVLLESDDSTIGKGGKIRVQGFPYAIDSGQGDEPALTIINLFRQSIDKEKIIYAGHSLGGMTATLMISGDEKINPFYDPRISAAISYDGVYFSHPVCEHLKETSACLGGEYKDFDGQTFGVDPENSTEIVSSNDKVKSKINLEYYQVSKPYRYLSSDLGYGEMPNEFSWSDKSMYDYVRKSANLNKVLVNGHIIDPNLFSEQFYEVSDSGHYNFMDTECINVESKNKKLKAPVCYVSVQFDLNDFHKFVLQNTLEFIDSIE